MATQAVAINLPALLFVVFHDELGASTAALGTLVAATFGVQMAVDALGARFIDRIGYRAAAVASELLSAAGLLLLVALPPLFPKPSRYCLGRCPNLTAPGLNGSLHLTKCCRNSI